MLKIFVIFFNLKCALHFCIRKLSYNIHFIFKFSLLFSLSIFRIYINLLSLLCLSTLFLFFHFLFYISITFCSTFWEAELCLKSVLILILILIEVSHIFMLILCFWCLGFGYCFMFVIMASCLFKKATNEEVNWKQWNSHFLHHVYFLNGKKYCYFFLIPSSIILLFFICMLYLILCVPLLKSQ